MVSNLPTNYLQVISKYAVFEGRAGRKEYWLFILANLIVSVAIGLAAAGVSAITSMNLMFISTIYAFAVLLPGLGVSVRRLHDINRSGWWVLLGLIPFIGSVALIVMHCLPGTEGDNQFGARPKEIGLENDPELMGEIAENEFEEALRKLKEATVASLTGEKQLEAQLRKHAEEIENWTRRAAAAVQSGTEDIARQCLHKKVETSAIAEALTSQLQAQKEATATLKAKFEEMQQQFHEFRMKKSSLAARDRASDGKLNSQDNPDQPNGASAFDRWEEKIRMKEAVGEAHRELSSADQERKLMQLTKQSDLEDELAELKRKVSGDG